ncbi:MAG: phosphotransferase, partial [Chloroflexi bacterium]|nr:phosphotransferase [Chloroflexota bacterium]
MKDFYSLTVRGRARRLRKLALNALQHYDLDVLRVRLLTNQYNGIFRLDTADGGRYVLRIHLPDEFSTEELRSTVMWMDALARETDIKLPHPVLNRNGDLVTLASAPGVPEPRQCAVFTWVPGANLDDQITPDNVAQQGELMARLHVHAATFQPPAGFTIRRYDQWYPFPEPVVLFDDAYGEHVEDADREMFRYAISRVNAALDRLLSSGDPLRAIHADLHQWNVKLSRGQVYVIDFDDTTLGFPIQDVGTTLFYYHWDERF